MEHESDYFAAPKPYLERVEPRKGHIAVTVFSILVFSSIFLFVTDNKLDLLIQFLIVLILHETGHYLFMKFFGYENVRMLFIPLMGAFVHGTKKKYSQIQSLIIILAGPIPGIVIGIICWYFAVQTQNSWLMQLTLLFFLINVSNLIPLSPLDGGRLMSTLFLSKSEILHLSLLGVFSLCLLVLAIYNNNLFVFVIGLVTFLQVRALYRRYKLHVELKNKKINYELTYEDLTDGAYQRIKKILLERSPSLRKYIEEIDDEDSSTIVATEVSNVLISPVEENAHFWLKLSIILLWILAMVFPFILIISNQDVLKVFYAF